MSLSGKLARILLVAHLGALVFGLAGMLIALPNADLWADQEWGVRTFDFGMRYGGALHIVLGAAAMTAFGIAAIGWRKTIIFFAVSVPLSLTSELIGTGTGWPFGNYAYTDFLGYKVGGHVPFSIPLSWFYVGFASFILGSLIARNVGWRPIALYAVGLGTWLLTVWDLVLDPAMAHESLPVQFWTWSESGAYFDMPLKNFVGWSLTALLFMGISRWLWRDDIDPRRDRIAVWFPLTIYAANMAFAAVLSASVGLWPPIILAIGLGLIPALFAWRSHPPSRSKPDLRHAPAAR